jgi:hypothetical protein
VAFPYDFGVIYETNPRDGTKRPIITALLQLTADNTNKFIQVVRLQNLSCTFRNITGTKLGGQYFQPMMSTEAKAPSTGVGIDLRWLTGAVSSDDVFENLISNQLANVRLGLFNNDPSFAKTTPQLLDRGLACLRSNGYWGDYFSGATFQDAQGWHLSLNFSSSLPIWTTNAGLPAVDPTKLICPVQATIAKPLHVATLTL